MFSPGERSRMEPRVMTAEELREYLRTLPEQVIVRVTIQEDDDGAEQNESI